MTVIKYSGGGGEEGIINGMIEEGRKDRRRS